MWRSALSAAIKTANREIIREAARDEHLKGMGTTVVAATIMNQMMYFANVGDSRLYLINQGIQQLYKGPFACGRDGAPRRHQAGGGKAPSG